MSIKGGYFKKYLHVDLSANRLERRGLSDAFLEKYIGGRGFGAKLVWDNLKKYNFRVNPLGEENLVVIAPGPLTGAYLPSSGKNSFVAISPATNFYGDSSVGGGFGVDGDFGIRPQCSRGERDRPYQSPCFCLGLFTQAN